MHLFNYLYLGENMSKYSLLILLLSITASFAGVTNPDISAIGQVFMTHTDDTLVNTHNKFDLTLGETELDLDAALNPYFNGAFVFSIDGEGGIEVEEAYVTMIKGLPLNLALKAGKYRLNFGKLNQVHPHAYPFMRTPRVLAPEVAKLLPGVESFDDLAAEASTLVPVVGSWAITASADFLGGRSFHPDEGDIAHAWLAHISNTLIVGSADCDIGASITQGINNVHTNTKTTVLGLDAKTKIAGSPMYSLTIGSEYLYKLSEIADTAGIKSTDNRYGFYAYINNQFHTRYNAGVLYEQYQDPNDHTSYRSCN